MTIPAFRYVDGKLVPCENYGSSVRLLLPDPDWGRFTAWSRRERRKLARQTSGAGRRRAVPVPKWPMPTIVDVRFEVLRGHLMRYGAGAEALLYLPAGESVNDRHCADMTALLYRVTA